MKFIRSMAWLGVLLAVSCGPDSKEAPPPPPAHKPLSERLGESNGFKVDEDGNWVPRTDKRSSFESQGQSPYFQGNYGKKSYQAPEYRRKSWWGNKDYGSQKYDGNTDGSRFQSASRFDGQGAREAGKPARIPDAYKTETYATGAAREAATRTIAKPSDAETDSRQRDFQQPEIIDWRQQRAVTLEQSRGILGR